MPSKTVQSSSFLVVTIIRMEPINCAAIRLREGKLCPAWIIQPNNTKTIAVNCLTSRVDNKNGKCGGLHPKAKHNDFYRVMALLIICLGLAVIKCKPIITGYCVNEHLENGLGLVASRIWHELPKICSYHLNSIS